MKILKTKKCVHHVLYISGLIMVLYSSSFLQSYPPLPLLPPSLLLLILALSLPPPFSSSSSLSYPSLSLLLLLFLILLFFFFFFFSSFLSSSSSISSSFYSSSSFGSFSPISSSSFSYSSSLLSSCSPSLSSSLYSSSFFLPLLFSFLLFFLFFFLYLSLSLSSLPISYPPFPLLPLPPLLNVFFLNLSCVYNFCLVLLNFTCLRVAVCLSMFFLIKVFFKHIIKHCSNRTQYPDPVGTITGYPVPGWKTAPSCALLLWSIIFSRTVH